ncbi:TPA: AAA family ATPase [Enterococcus faecium]
MQIIYYGAPGTGKSYSVDELVKASGVGDDRIFRTTFHPEYTYNDFVGQLLPKVEKTASGATNISYEFTKGVFTRALEKAYEDTAKEVFLILKKCQEETVQPFLGIFFNYWIGNLKV